MKKPRLLLANEIVVRPQSETNKGIIALLYKNARCDMNILDETFGIENWQRRHYECKGNLFCEVGVRCDNGDWVWKGDAGTESNMDKEKGEASDSFKRACVNWGIGRELYTPIFIWINKGDYVVKEYTDQRTKEKKEKFADKLYVSRYECNENREIIKLEIKNKSHKVCFSMGYGTVPKEPVKQEPYKCCQCGNEITKKTHDLSIKKYEVALCSAECVEKNKNG